MPGSPGWSGSGSSPLTIRPWVAWAPRRAPMPRTGKPQPAVGRHRRVCADSHLMTTLRCRPHSGSPRPGLRPPSDWISAPAASTDAWDPATPEPARRGSRSAPPRRTCASGRGCGDDVQFRRFAGGWAPWGCPAPKVAPSGATSPGRMRPVAWSPGKTSNVPVRGWGDAPRVPAYVDRQALALGQPAVAAACPLPFGQYSSFLTWNSGNPRRIRTPSTLRIISGLPHR